MQFKNTCCQRSVKRLFLVNGVIKVVCLQKSHLSLFRNPRHCEIILIKKRFERTAKSNFSYRKIVNNEEFREKQFQRELLCSSISKETKQAVDNANALLQSII